jgi:uncharacterized protein YceK
MRRLLVLAVVLLAGCAHASTVATSSGTTVTTTTASVSASSSSSTGWVLLGIILIGMEINDPTRPLNPRPPPMDAARRVNEQDCTQPIVDASANLRCK